MRYTAKKDKENFIVTGIKEMMTVDGDMVDIEFATKSYDKKKLKEVLDGYKQERELAIQKYDNDILDLEAILEAINSAK